MVLIGSLALVVMLTLGATAAVLAQTPGPNNGMGNNNGQGGMMNGGAGYGQGGMMGSNFSDNAATQPLTVDEARSAATKYLAGLKNTNLAIDEIMIFDNNAYVAIKDTSTGVGAFELLVNPVTTVAYGEYGPNMMWNLLYGHMSGNGHNANGMGRGGMMSGGPGMMSGGPVAINSGSYQPGKMPVTAEQALQTAQTYLDKAYPGVKAGQKADEFPGYYTVEVQLNGKISGMLSVNGYTGQVWYHTWHGQFIEMADYGK